MGYLASRIDESFVLGQTFLWWTILAMIASVTGTLGDLLESKLKRMADVKDSGHIMPGHGGFSR
jgi:phosphatidate cytidylyltransferase